MANNPGLDHPKMAARRQPDAPASDQALAERLRNEMGFGHTSAPIARGKTPAAPEGGHRPRQFMPGGKG